MRPNVVLMLSQGCRRWANIKTTLDQPLIFTETSENLNRLSKPKSVFSAFGDPMGHVDVFFRFLKFSVVYLYLSLVKCHVCGILAT